MRLFYLSTVLCCVVMLYGCSKAQGVAEPAKPSQTYEGDADEKLSDRANAEADSLRSRISTELEGLPKHAWAGSYYQGDGLGENVSLILAPKHGYLFEWHGCMGLYDRNYGNVTVNQASLKLSFTYPNVRQGFQGIADEFLSISWGDRQYLIPKNDVIGFCNDVNSGDEPRQRPHGRFLLRDGDESIAVTGIPKLPAKYNAYLLKHPIEAQVVEIGAKTTRPSVCEWNFIDTEIVLNVGTNAGILPGMELHVVEPDDVVQTIEIKTVAKSQCTGVMTQMDDEDEQIQVGWKLSTRQRWNAQ